jgi:hypothetical protein
MRLPLALVLSAAFAGTNCKRTPTPPPPSTSAATPSSPTSAGPARLPEDPVAARKATEQWREHLVHEELVRKQQFDRQRMKEHEAILAALEQARGRYDTAKTMAQVKRAKVVFHAALPALEKRVLAIDPERQNSKLLEDYEALFETFDGPYVAARLASLDGDARALTELTADVDRRIAKARAWLTEDGHEERERLEDGRHSMHERRPR